jgi:membrane protein implicated in regulation of membrane protease activity
MAKILYYKSKRENVIVIVLLAISVVVTNSFIIFLPNEDSRFYISGLMSTVAVGVALVIAIIEVWTYKKGIKKKEEEKQQVFSQQDRYTKPCLFLVL